MQIALQTLEIHPTSMPRPSTSVERTADRHCDVDDAARSRAAHHEVGPHRRTERALQDLIAAMLAGATHIDHVDVVREWATQAVWPFEVMASSDLVPSADRTNVA